jgi:Transmembrane amino acid transporter protein
MPASSSSGYDYGSMGTGDFTKTPEMIRPSPSNPSRKSDHTSATFNLIATIVGGGVLSLPYAFSQVIILFVCYDMALRCMHRCVAAAE